MRIRQIKPPPYPQRGHREAYNPLVTTLLQANSLTKRYGATVALDSVDFEVQEGITGLLGPNGAGKSTAIKLFLGLLKPTAGSAEVMGEKPYEAVEARARLGYMPEHDCLPTAITASEFLTHMAQVSGIPPAFARIRAADILRHVGLEEERYRPIGQYSTGMKQRVKLAQSLAHDPLVVPILLFGAAMTPAVIMAIVASLFDGISGALPGHADYYQVVSIVLIIFAALVAPELLCPDRRNGVISLYLVRPLSTTDYVVARWLAFFSITLLLVYSGQAVLLASLILSAEEPLDYIKDHWQDVPRILGAGLLVAIFITTLPLAVSAFTNRRAIAAAIVIGLFIISSAAAGILTECDEGHAPDRSGQCEPLTGDSAKWFSLVDIGRVPTNVNNMIFDVEDEGRRSQITSELPVLFR